MKLLALIVIAVIVAGGIYHEDVARYFGKMTKASYSTASTSSSPSVINSVRRTGNSGSNLMSGVGNSINR